MAEFVTTTRVYETPNTAINKYAAFLQLTHGREINKEQAFNELVLLGAISALPREIAKGLELEKALAEIRDQPSAQPAPRERQGPLASKKGAK